MKLAWVLPWIHRVGGNKTILSLSNELVKQNHEVWIVSHTIKRGLGPELQRLAGATHFVSIAESDAPYSGHLAEVSWLLSGQRTYEIARLLAKVHVATSLDVIILVGNECHGLARALRGRLGDPPPRVGISVMELIDHSFLLRRERDHPILRGMTSPLYPLIHRASARDLEAYDFLMANSDWTGLILRYLYGLSSDHALVSIPEEAFEGVLDSAPKAWGRYIAVPTASVGRAEVRLLAGLRDAGLPLVSYGPRSISGLRHLGYLSERDMRAVIQNAAATLFLFDYEALGLIPFESLALGTPVVTQPKHGVFQQWRGSPYVSFQSELDGLIRACSVWLERPLGPADKARAIGSVRPYSAFAAAESFVAFLHDSGVFPRRVGDLPVRQSA